MSTRPEPAMLAPTDARAMIREIRRRDRPLLLDELRRLYRTNDDEVTARAEILAGEIQLQKLDQYLVSLLPVVRQQRGRLGWECFRPRWRAVQQDAGGVQAEIDLAFSPENHECVHGPFTLVAVGDLARRLLADGERLASIERVTWAVPLRHRLKLRVWDAAQATATSAAEGAVSGRLRTSLGRTLDFAGVPVLDHPLVAQRDYNGLSPALVRGKRFVFPEPNHLILELAEDGLAACRRAVRARPALCAALVLDLVPLAILNWKRGRPMMACGYRDVPVPAPSSAAFAPGTRLELRYRPDLSHASARSGLWIGYYEFRYAPRQSDWSTMVMAEADDLHTLLRKVHS
jgi:hypothetical protein